MSRFLNLQIILDLCNHILTENTNTMKIQNSKRKVQKIQNKTEVKRMAVLSKCRRKMRAAIALPALSTMSKSHRNNDDDHDDDGDNNDDDNHKDNDDDHDDDGDNHDDDDGDKDDDNNHDDNLIRSLGLF